MQHQYLPKSSEVSEARFQKFLKEFANYELVWNKTRAEDHFLDAYSIWLRHRSPVSYEILREATLALRALDASFRFPLPTTGMGDFTDA